MASTNTVTTIHDRFGAPRFWDLCQQAGTRLYGDRPPTPEYADHTARLLFGTAAQESSLIWERQLSPVWDGNVGGFSKCQLEINSIRRSLEFIKARPALLRRATDFVFNDPRASVNWIDEMTNNMSVIDPVLWALRMDDNDRLGLLFCRVHYMWVTNNPIPGDLGNRASYWKYYYNTTAGSGTHAQYIENWFRLCQPVAGDSPYEHPAVTPANPGATVSA